MTRFPRLAVATVFSALAASFASGCAAFGLDRGEGGGETYPISAFLEAQGSDSEGIPTDHPVRYHFAGNNKQLSMVGHYPARGVSIDYNGWYASWLRDARKIDLGTTQSGDVRVKSLGDSRKEVRVHLEFERAYLFVVNLDRQGQHYWEGEPYAGYWIKDLPDIKHAGLASGSYDITYEVDTSVNRGPIFKL